MKAAQILFILQIHRRFILLAGIVFFLASLTISLLLPKTYHATVEILIGPDTANILSLNNNTLQPPVSEYVTTQLAILGSQKVALRAVDILGLQTDQDAIQAYKQSGATESLPVFYAGWLQRNTSAAPSGRDSRLVTLTFKGRNPQQTAKAANAYAQAFKDSTVALIVGPAREQAEWYEKKGNELKAMIAKKQRLLSEAQRKAGIIVNDGEDNDVETKRLAELSSQIALAQGQYVESRQRLNVAQQNRGNLTSIPDVATNPLIQTLTADKVRAQSDLSDAASKYGVNHPEYVRAAARVAELEKRIAQQADTIVASLKKNNDLADQRLKGMQDALDSQNKRILNSKSPSDAIEIMRQEIQDLKSNYDAILGKAAQNNLTSEIRDGTVQIVSPAEPPSRPSSPRLGLNVLLGTCLGLILAGAWSIFREMRDLRVRLAADIEAYLGVPVLAEAPMRVTRGLRLSPMSLQLGHVRRLLLPGK